MSEQQELEGDAVVEEREEHEPIEGEIVGEIVDDLPGGELERRTSAVIPTDNEWLVMRNIAMTVANTDFVPGALRGRATAVMACILYGREVGIGPMESLREVNVIDGRPSMSANLQLALIRKAGHHVHFEYVEKDERPYSVTAVGWRKDEPEYIERIAWTMDMAREVRDRKGALLADKANWKNYPRAMLRARATAELARTLFGDVLGSTVFAPGEAEELPANGS
jgi:hypothetical protein